jgi:hypothetical protein
VNAHGCGVIVHERLKNETPVMVKLIANGAIAKGRVVLAIQLLENASWLLGVEFDTPGTFGQLKIRHQTGGCRKANALHPRSLSTAARRSLISRKNPMSPQRSFGTKRKTRLPLN